VVHDSRPKTQIHHRRSQLLSGKYRNNGATRSPPQVNKFGQDDDGERRPRPECRIGRVTRVRAPERYGPSAAILYTVLCTRTHGTTPHSLHGHPFLITRSHARARALTERIYGGGVISGHTDAHTVTLTHTHTRRTIRVRVAAGGTESHQLYTTHDDGGGGKYTHDTDTATLILLRSSVVSRVRDFTAHGGSGVTRFTYTRDTRFAVVDAHTPKHDDSSNYSAVNHRIVVKWRWNASIRWAVEARSRRIIVRYCPCTLFVRFPSTPPPPFRSAWCARWWPRWPFPSCPRGLHTRDECGFISFPRCESLPWIAGREQKILPDDRWLCVWSHDTTWTQWPYFTEVRVSC